MTEANKPKIIISLMGGLGNQLFQYSLYKWFILKDYNVFLDIHKYNLKNKPAHEEIKLSYFNINNLKIIDFEEASKYIDFAAIYKFKSLSKLHLDFFILLKTVFLKIIRKIIRCIQIEPKHLNCFIMEKPKEGFSYIKNLKIVSNTYIFGTFTYYECLNDIKQSLINDITFTRKLPNIIKELLDEFKLYNSVAIHVRRGDYEGDRIRDVCSMTYYHNSIEYVSSNQNNLRFYIFSNDPEYIKTNFSFLSNYFFIDNSLYDNSDYLDLFLMTQVNHLIISNSTFSYWGAWLNKNINKIVIAPNCYHSDNSWVHQSELYPPEWIRLAVN